MIIPAALPLKLDTSKLNSEVVEWTSLKTADIINGRVISASSDSAMIQMLGARLEVRTPVPLSPGNVVQFQVESNSGGQLTLRALLKPTQQSVEDTVDAENASLTDQVSIEKSPSAAVSNARLSSIRDAIDNRLLSLQSKLEIPKAVDRPIDPLNPEVEERDANTPHQSKQSNQQKASEGSTFSNTNTNKETAAFKNAVALENIVSVDGSQAFGDLENNTSQRSATPVSRQPTPSAPSSPTAELKSAPAPISTPVSQTPLSPTVSVPTSMPEALGSEKVASSVTTAPTPLLEKPALIILPAPANSNSVAPSKASASSLSPSILRATVPQTPQSPKSAPTASLSAMTAETVTAKINTLSSAPVPILLTVPKISTSPTPVRDPQPPLESSLDSGSTLPIPGTTPGLPPTETLPSAPTSPKGRFHTAVSIATDSQALLLASVGRGATERPSAPSQVRQSLLSAAQQSAQILPAVVGRETSTSQPNLPSLAETELGTALARAGLPPTVENLTALRQALSDGRAIALSRLRLRETYQTNSNASTAIEVDETEALSQQDDMLSAALERAGLQATPENVVALRSALIPEFPWDEMSGLSGTGTEEIGDAEAETLVGDGGDLLPMERGTASAGDLRNTGTRMLPKLSANALRSSQSQAPHFNSPEQAAFFSRISSDYSLTSRDAPLAAALIRSGVAVTPNNVASLRLALNEGQARSLETLSLLKSAGIDPTPLQTDYLDAVLDRDAPKLGALMSQNSEARTSIQNFVLNADEPSRQNATVLRNVLSRLVEADAAVTSKSQEIATNLRGQVLLPAVQSVADVPSPYVYFQMPCQTRQQWRTVEMKLERGPAAGRGKLRSTDIVLRLETQGMGTVEVRLQAFGRDVAISMRVTDPAAREKLAAFQQELTRALDKASVNCTALHCNVVAGMEPLTQPTPQPVDING